MKKLLITVIGAAAALGASAGAISTQQFETEEVGTTKTIEQLNAGAGGTYWSGDELTNTYEIVAVSPAPTAYSLGTTPTKGLGIKTTFGNPLTLKAKTDGSGTTIPASGLYFDSVVKFTVCDADQNTAYAAYNGAKIVMWLEQTEDESKTNLIVRAGYLSKDNGQIVSTPTNYVCTLTGGIDVDAWHRVTIKAIGDITTTDDKVPGFAIYIDQMGATPTTDINCSEAKWDNTFDAELVEAAEMLNKYGALFPTLDLTTGARQSLASVSFDGTGALTDTCFTDDGPAFAKDMVATKASVKIGDAAANDYGSLAEAVAAVNGASEGVNVEFKLAKSMTLAEPLEFTSSANVVFDFHGQVLENTAAVCAITNAAGAITFIDSGVGGGITCTESTAGAVYVKNATGTGATFAGGIFRSTVAPVEWFMMASGKIHFTGGSYAVKNSAYDTRAAADNKVFQYNNETALYDVVDAPNYAAQIGQQGYETFAKALAAAVDGDTITLLGDVTEPKFSIGVAKFGVQGLTIDLGDYTYTFEASNKDAIELLSSNKVTIANGTFAAASGSTFRDFVRDYNSNLTLNNVTIDGANFPAADDTKLACLLCIEGGDVNVLGSTSIINVKSDAYAIKMGNHAQAWYEMGTTTINTTGNIMGNILIAGGVYNEVAVGSDSTINYYYGKNVHSSWEDGVSSANFAARLGTLAETGAQDNVSGQLFKTLKDAVDAASAGDTVTVLADCTISTSLSIAKNLTVHNDHTITGAVNYAICIGAAVTFEGSGKIERASNISGSAFCVGANEKTRGAITAGTAGTLNFDGLTVCGGSGGNLIKLENGTVNMNGGVLKDGLRGIKADADAGNYTSTIVINGGTITNCSNCAVMASAESANGTATVTINGGNIFSDCISTVSNGMATVTISGGNIVGVLSKETKTGGTGTATLTIPGTSTAKFDRDQSAFCADGYETTQSEGWYVVTKVQPPVTPIVPDQGGSAEYADAAAATAAAAAINANKENLITVDANVTGDAKTTYLSKVEAVANGNTVTIQFTADAKPVVQAEVDGETAKLPLAEIAAATGATEATVTATPGCYYTVKSGTEPGSLTAGTPVLATGTTVTLPIPNKGAAGFYKIEVKPTK